MQLNTTTNYAISTVIYLGRRNERVKAEEISRELGVPFNYLTKIMGVLRKNNIIDTKNGVDGGHLLKISTRKISVFDIIVMFQGRKTIVKCLSDDSACKLNNSKMCFLKNKFAEFQDIFDSYFQDLIIADLIDTDINIKEE